MMMEFQTLADQLEAIGKPAGAQRYRCTVEKPFTGKVCGYVGKAGEFAAVGDVAIVNRDYICGGCFQDVLAQARIVGGLLAALTGPPATWDDPVGANLKGERNTRIQRWAWTVDATSPLTPECQEVWRQEYFRPLNRMTVDCERPGLWVWPVEPEQVFA